MSFFIVQAKTYHHRRPRITKNQGLESSQFHVVDATMLQDNEIEKKKEDKNVHPHGHTAQTPSIM